MSSAESAIPQPDMLASLKGESTMTAPNHPLAGCCYMRATEEAYACKAATANSFVSLGSFHSNPDTAAANFRPLLPFEFCVGGGRVALVVVVEQRPIRRFTLTCRLYGF